MSAVCTVPSPERSRDVPPAPEAAATGCRRVPLHPDRQLRGPAAAIECVAAGEHLPGQQAAGRPRRGRRAVHARAHLRPPHGPGGGYPAAHDRHAQPGLAAAQRPGHRPARSSRPASTMPASCRARATSPATSASTRWPGPARSCGWSTPASRACARCTPITASCRAGGRRSSRRLAAEDRCHLNGLAMVDGRPQYVTALGETDTPGAGGRPGPGRLPDRRAQRRSDQPGACRCPTRRACTTAGSGCWSRGPGGWCLWMPPRSGCRALPSCPASPAAWRLRPVCLHRAVQDPRDLRHGRRAAGRAAGGAEMRRGGGGPAQRRTGRLAGVPDGRGGDLRRATLARPALPEVIGFQQETIHHTFIVPGGREIAGLRGECQDDVPGAERAEACAAQWATGPLTRGARAAKAVHGPGLSPAPHAAGGADRRDRGSPAPSTHRRRARAHAGGLHGDAVRDNGEWSRSMYLWRGPMPTRDYRTWNASTWACGPQTTSGPGRATSGRPCGSRGATGNRSGPARIGRCSASCWTTCSRTPATAA